jgi:hypothetical protein
MEWLVNHNTPELLFETILNIGRQERRPAKPPGFPGIAKGQFGCKDSLGESKE